MNTVRKNNGHAFTIISGLLVVAGILLYLYPQMANLLSVQHTDNEINRFEQAVQAMEQQNDNKAEAIDKAKANDKTEATDKESAAEKAELTPLDRLYRKVQLYNQSIYEEGQSGLVDAFSYETDSVDLSQYGIKDNMFGYLEIPAIKIKLGIYLGATLENMSKGAVHLTQTSLPIGGINTNAVLAAHRGTRQHGDMFRNINKIKLGDKVYITNAWGTLNYKVIKIAIIKPNEIDKILIQKGKDMVTLISCNPYGQHIQRYVVYCGRVSEND